MTPFSKSMVCWKLHRTTQIRLCLQIGPSEINRNHIIVQKFHGFHSHCGMYHHYHQKKHQTITRNPSQSPIFDGKIGKKTSNKSPQISEDLRSSQDFPGFPKSQIIQQLPPSPQPPSHHSTFQRVLREDLSSQVELIDHGGERGVFHGHAVASASH